MNMTVSDMKIRQKFFVVRQLGADDIIGCQFVDRAVEFLAVQKRKIILRNEAVVPVIRCRAIVPTDID